MAALSADTTLTSRERGRSRYKIDDAGAVTIFAGGLVGLVAATGLITPWNNVATTQFLGLALEGAVSTSGASPQTEVRVAEDGAIVTGAAVTSAVQANVGDEVFCTTDNTQAMALTATSKAVGTLVAFRTASDCDVRLYTPAEFAANA